jgi:hypothetical protein
MRQKPLESTVILVFEGSLAPPKTNKNQQKTSNIQLFPVFEGLSKTIKKRQKPLESTVILVS